MSLFLFLFLLTSTFAGPPSPDRLPKIFFEAQSNYRGIQFFKSEPEIRMISEEEVEVRMDTLIPTPPGLMYYGHYHPNQNFPYPRLRFKAKELDSSGNQTVHRFRIPMDSKTYNSVEKPKYDAARVRDSGGVIPLTFSFYNSKKQSTDIYQTSFRYYKDAQGKRSLQANIIAGPFYDTHKASHAVISMVFDQEARGFVTLRRPGTSRTIKKSFQGKNPEVVFRSLKEGARYLYSVQIANTVDGKVVSHTSTEELPIRIPNSRFKPFSFACMSDSRSGHGIGEVEMQGTNSKSIKHLFRLAYDRGADFIFFPGDLIDGYNTELSDYMQQYLTWKKASTPVHRLIPVFEGIGNHESYIDRYVVSEDSPYQPIAYGNFSYNVPQNPSEVLFSSQFVNPKNGPVSEGGLTPPYDETVYSVVLNGVGFVMVNSNYWYSSDPETIGGNLEGYIMDRQMEWIEKEIDELDQRNDVRYIFVFTHEPPYPNSVHYKDAMYYNGGVPEKNSGFERYWVVERRDRFWKALSSSPKTMFAMFGDEHNYSRLTIPANKDKGFKHELTQLISGGVGAPYYSEVTNLPWSKHLDFVDWKQNYVHVQVAHEGVTVQAVSSTGEIMDQVLLKGRE